MSAIQALMDNNAVDPGHRLEQLVRMLQPHLSHLIIMPRQQPIIDLDDRETTAICHPIDKMYVMTTKGLAYVTRTFFGPKPKPRLMSHVGIALIDERARNRIISALEPLLDQQIRHYGPASVGLA